MPPRRLGGSPPRTLPLPCPCLTTSTMPHYQCLHSGCNHFFMPTTTHLGVTFALHWPPMPIPGFHSSLSYTPSLFTVPCLPFAQGLDPHGSMATPFHFSAPYHAATHCLPASHTLSPCMPSSACLTCLCLWGLLPSLVCATCASLLLHSHFYALDRDLCVPPQAWCSDTVPSFLPDWDMPSSFHGTRPFPFSPCNGITYNWISNATTRAGTPTEPPLPVSPTRFPILYHEPRLALFRHSSALAVAFYHLFRLCLCPTGALVHRPVRGCHFSSSRHENLWV